MSSLDEIPLLTEKVRVAREALVAAETELKSTVAAIRTQLDVALGKAHKPKGGRPGVRLSLVEPLWKQGKTPKEISDLTGIANSNVHAAIAILVKRRDAEEALIVPPPAPPAPTRADADDEDADAATIDELADAAKAQRGYMKGKRARLMTSERKGHKHVGDIDLDGDGFATPGGKDRHVHRINKFLVGPGADGHRHDLTVIGADS